MDEKPDVSPTPKPDLASAVRRAREENAERAEAISSLREIEAGRLALLESALKSVVRQAPPDVDMFDLTLTQGDKPRLFLDMIAFVEMARDRRTYRFFQDTLHGRVLIAQSDQMARIVAAATNYVARRLVERERALAAGEGEAEAPEPDTKLPVTWSIRPAARPAEAARAVLASAPAASRSFAPAPSEPAPPPAARPRKRWSQRLGDALSFLLMTLGSITLIVLLAAGAYLAWTVRLRDLWVQLLHRAPPF